TSEMPHRFVEYARMRDLTIVPAPAAHVQWLAEAIIFGSGRPTLVLPEISRPKPPRLDHVIVAWDFSRPAARAVADAIPLLEKAKRVHILTVTNEKAIDSNRSSAELARNLARHGIDVVVDRILRTQAASSEADLLVMGAYGHSRFREFVLGGATRDILANPPVPVLFSHWSRSEQRPAVPIAPSF